MGVLAYGRALDAATGWDFMGLNGTYVPDSTSPTGVIRAKRGQQLPGSKRFRHPVSRPYAVTPIRQHVSLLAPASRL